MINIENERGPNGKKDWETPLLPQQIFRCKAITIVLSTSLKLIAQKSQLKSSEKFK